jgi:hypothetical protein
MTEGSGNDRFVRGGDTGRSAWAESTTLQEKMAGVAWATWLRNDGGDGGHGSRNFMSPLQGLGKWGDELYPGCRFACPGLVYFGLSGQEDELLRRRGSTIVGGDDNFLWG